MHHVPCASVADQPRNGETIPNDISSQGREGASKHRVSPCPPYQLKPPIPTNFFGPLKRIVFHHIRQTHHDDCQHFWPYFWPFERSLIAFKPISIAWLSIDILLSYCSLREYERILPSPSCLSICSSTSFSIYPLTCFLERWPEKSSTKSLVRRYEKCLSNLIQPVFSFANKLPYFFG